MVLRALSNNVFKIEKMLVIILLPITLFAMTFDIFFRYFFNSPLIWGQELTLYTFVWTSFIGASMSIKTKEAVAVTIFVDKLNYKFRNLFILVGLFVSSVFAVFILYLSVSWITNPHILIQKSVTTQTPMILMYFCIPFSLFFMSIHFINWFIESFRLTREGKVIE